MSYKFKGQYVIINGEKQYVIASALPSSPTDGYFCLDQADGRLKIYHDGRWVILGSVSVEDDDSNRVNNVEVINFGDGIKVTDDGSNQITATRLFKTGIQFQYIGQMNYDQYLYAGEHLGDDRRSGDPSNGYRYQNSAPILSPLSGKVKKAIFNVRGVAQSTGSAASTVTLKMELWKVGSDGSEGTKLGDVEIDIDSGTYTIGNWWDSSIVTDFAGSSDLDISVSEGDLLGLKFIRQTGNSNVVSVNNATVNLLLEEE